MEYILHLLVLIGIYAALASSLDLLVGRLGLLSIAHAGFFGIGAYSSALLSVDFGLPFVATLPVGMMIAASISLPISWASLRLRDDYFAIGTFGLQLIFFNVANNWMSVTRGPMGIPGIPQPSVMGWEVDTVVEFAWLSLLLSGFTYLLVGSLVTSPYGRLLQGIREDEYFVLACGKGVVKPKLVVVALSSAFAAMAGSIYASYVTFIDPTSFTVMESVLILSMVIIGGAGSLWGPLIGAIALVSLPEVLRFVGLPAIAAGNLRQILYGLALILLMLIRPQGLLGRYRFDK